MMTEFLIFVCLIDIAAIIFLFFKIRREEKIKSKNSKQIKNQDSNVGFIIIKRDKQGAQASVHFNSDFDLFQYEDGDYIFLGVRVEEVKD